MITLLIGHRGTGKTSFLRGLQKRSRRQANFLDLDEEIPNFTGKTVDQWFVDGEAAFRKAEQKTLRAILDSVKGGETYIALGAGFEGPPPAGARVIWIRRETDPAGRIFLGRPRLNPDLSPLDEFRHRFAVREHRFAAWAHEQLILPEGYESGLEDFVLDPQRLHVPYDFTLRAEHFRAWDTFRERRATWGTRRFELRDDLLSERQIQIARATLPAEKLLFAARRGVWPKDAGWVDWALEQGPAPGAGALMSRHEREGSLTQTLADFDQGKLAVEIADFRELELGHDWWFKNKSARAFLPRSTDGRWRWYRSLFGARMPVHYYREDEGSAADQPLLWQMVLQPQLVNGFAAVLGSPVKHSRSPAEHLAYFRDRNIPFVAIDVPEEEFSGALEFLIKLGLKYAAVTAPLKKRAFEACHRLTPEAERLRAVNTLKIDGDGIEGHNTDVLALKEIAADFRGEAWLWGGGGVRSSVSEAFAGVKEFSARNGRPREGTHDFNAPAVLIWAAGRGGERAWPPESVKTGLVLDLNYGDDSPGLEWAVKQNLPYQSGLKMFKLQAEFQRRFWSMS